MIIADPQHILPVILHVGHRGLVPYHDIVHDIGGRPFPSVLFRIESRATHLRDVHQVTVGPQ